MFSSENDPNRTVALPVSWAAGGGMFRHAVLRLQLDGDDGLEGSEFGGPSSFGPY